MSLDLIDRVLYLSSKGESEPIERFYYWLGESTKTSSSNFYVKGIKYYWKVISSEHFKDIIDEDIRDWLLIHTEDNKFKALAKFRSSYENLIGERTHWGITTLWLLQSDLLHNGESRPILIFTPHYFSASLNFIEYDIKKLIQKLNNPKVKLFEFIIDKRLKDWRRRIR